VRWNAGAPEARVAALQFPVLLQKARDGRARARGRVPSVRFALNVGVGVRVAVESARGDTLAAWGLELGTGPHVVGVPDRVARQLGRGRYRLVVTPAGGVAARRGFAVV
jgi:hypothetical protein